MRTARVLGLDIGSKTIGLAISDETGQIASPLETLSRRGTVKDVAAIAEVARRFQVDRLVAGVPYDEEGQIGTSARRVMVLVEALRQAGLTVEAWDEAFTTIKAQSALLEADLSRKRRKQVVDKVAAAIILQGWLRRNGAQAGPTNGHSEGHVDSAIDDGDDR